MSPGDSKEVDAIFTKLASEISCWFEALEIIGDVMIPFYEGVTKSSRQGPNQYVPFSLILWYVAKKFLLYSNSTSSWVGSHLSILMVVLI